MYPNLGVGAIGHKASLTEAIDFAQQFGFKGIDFSISEAQTLADAHGVDYVRDLFMSKNVLPGVMGFPVDFRRDENTWRDGLAALPAQAKLAQELGCQRTATWIPPGNNDRTFAESHASQSEILGHENIARSDMIHNVQIDGLAAAIDLDDANAFPLLHAVIVGCDHADGSSERFGRFFDFGFDRTCVRVNDDS